jgi:glutaminyl-peptide cyclotransferase
MIGYNRHMMSQSKTLPPRKRLSGQAIFLVASIAVCLVAVGFMALASRFRRADGATPTDTPTASTLRLEDIPFDGKQAYAYLKQLCDIGPRRSGSAGMQQQQQLLADHFKKCGGQVEFQRFRVAHPVDGSSVPMANMIVRWHPERRERIMLCGHYDTLPFPMRDPQDPHGTFLGANDNGSGVAVLMELARQMPEFPTKLGVDFVLFDGEEFIFTEGDRFFLGSEYFSREYVERPKPYHYRAAVLLDMVGAKDLHLYEEGNSISWQDSRPLVEQLWATAARLGVREFIPRQKNDGACVTEDDHLRLHDLAGIPSCDLIDEDYMEHGQPWHTRGDTPDKCSALSLAKVGYVLNEWLKTAESTIK